MKFNSVSRNCVGLISLFMITLTVFKHVKIGTIMKMRQETNRKLKTITDDIKIPVTSGIDKPITKLLILAYPRSGSTFISNLFSSSPNSFYMSEPFYYLRSHGHFINKMTHWDTTLSSKIEQNITSLFLCDKKILTAAMGSGRKGEPVPGTKNLDNCTSTNWRVLKTIRLNKHHLESWINESDIKIIHLIRDPRAILNSMMKWSQAWNEKIKHIGTICFDFLLNHGLEEILSSNKYYLLRFEDFLQDSNSTLVKMSNKLELDLDIGDMMKALAKYYEPAEETDFYYSPYRSKDFDPDKWKTELPVKELMHIERSCKRALKTFNYDLVLPEGKYKY